MVVNRYTKFVFPSSILLLMCALPVLAQTGKLKVHASPREAYIYADGKPVKEARGHIIKLAPGEHKIDLYNYGYKSETRSVTIEANKTQTLEVTMQAVPATLSGPWGCITLEGATRDAVLLNGKDPAFFVGHGDEFNNELGWKQELVVPPGKYDLTVMHGDSAAWSTSVDVPENQRVVVDANKGVRKTVPWTRGQKLKSMPHFKAGTASAEVVVQKVTGQFSATPAQLNCGDSAKLTWSSEGAVKTELNDAAVAPAGDQTVQPKQNTDYKFLAAGPGGVYTSTTTVNVASAINASISASPAEVRYHKVGDKLDQQPSATLTWSATGADSASVDPLGTVSPSGNREVPVTPSKISVGPVDETVTYTLHAGNACGGAATQTATLHIVGSIDPATVVNEATLETNLTFNSIYFPTNLPTVAAPDGGLVPSEEKRLTEIVTNFKQYLTLRPEANLILAAHADHRGSAEFNKALSQRRADRVKNYLVQNGIPAEKIQTKALGKEQNLTDKEVKDLAAQNPNVTPEDRKRVAGNMTAFRMANNRRVDVSLSTTGQTSQRYFPYNSDDLNVLLGEKKPARKATK